MAEEKKQLPPFKEFMEQMYGVKIDDPTPEELAAIGQWLEKSQQESRAKREQGQNQQSGPENMSSHNQ